MARQTRRSDPVALRTLARHCPDLLFVVSWLGHALGGWRVAVAETLARASISRGAFGSPIAIEAATMTNNTRTVDLEDGDESVPVTRETTRGGHEPSPELNDRPDQNVAYDEVVKGAPLTADEKARAERESPLYKK